MAYQSAYTPVELVTRIRSLYDETDSANSYITDAQIAYLANQVQLDITARHNIRPQMTTASGSSFDAYKELAATSTQTFAAVERVFLNNVELPRIEFEPYNDGRTVGYGYYLRGEYLGIPVVQSADDVVIYGRGQLTEIVSTSTASVDLPAVYMPALIDGTLALMYAKERDYQAHDFWQTKYEADINRAGASNAKNQIPTSIIKVV